MSAIQERGVDDAERRAPLVRPRLLRLLEDFNRSALPLQSVWSGAGTGKTTLLQQWVDRLRSTGSLTIDVDGNGRTGVIVSGPGPLRWVVIDDFDRRVDRTAAAALIAELTCDNPTTRMLVAGRSEPFWFADMVAGLSTTQPLTGSDLAFTAAETTSFARLFRIDLTARTGRLLTDRTEGWAAGLALALPYLSTQPDPAAAVVRFDGDERPVADYFVEQIVSQLAADDRDVLLHAAVASVVPLDLAVAASRRPDAGAVLNRVCRQNLLVERDGSEFRFHPVLLSYLDAESRRLDAGGAERAHACAADWYENHGEPASALEQALMSHSLQSISTHLESVGVDLLLQGRAAVVARALRAVASAPETPGVLLLRIALDAPGFPDRIETQRSLGRARDLLSRSVGSDASSRWGALAAALEALLADTFESAAASRARLKDIDAGGRSLDRGVALVVRAAAAWCCVVLGEHEAAERELDAILVAAQRAGYAWAYLVVSEVTSTAASRRGDWRSAEAYEDNAARTLPTDPHPRDRATARALLLRAFRAYARCEPESLAAARSLEMLAPSAAEFGLRFHSQVLLALGELDSGLARRDALHTLTQLIYSGGGDHPRVVSAVTLRLVYWTAQLHSAGDVVDVVRLIAERLGPSSLEARTVRLFLAAGADFGLEHAVRDQLATGPAAWTGTAVVQTLIVLGRRAFYSDRQSDAAAYVRDALDLACTYGYAREFLACEFLGAQLLTRLQGQLGVWEEQACEVLRLAAAAGFDPVDHGVAVSLTPKEMLLLAELPMHQTIAGIAAKHHLSVNTVKTHLRSVYAKLGASDRTEAVDAARRHGYL